MRICYIADYRSPIARNWIRYFTDREHEVYVISTHPVGQVDPGLAGFTHVPIGFAGFRANGTVRKHFAASRGQSGNKSNAVTLGVNRVTRGMGAMMLSAYEWIAPYELRRYASVVERTVRECRPQLVHAMRIPFEGILATVGLKEVALPLLISVWGNDFTLHATRVRTVGSATRRALARCDALHADCHRDIRLAAAWGLESDKPTKVIPTSGGVRRDVFHPDRKHDDTRRRWNIPDQAKIVINPRGFRPGYVRNDIFFASIPAVLKAVPDAVFLAVGMEGHAIAERWVRQYGIAKAVRLLPSMPHAEMASFFRSADVTVSPTNHDGTPNTLLEAMACGAFPVAGDIESVREWIEDGKNGLLCDPNSTESLARATIEALLNDSLREKGRSYNLELINERADYDMGMRMAEEFYTSLIGR